MKEPKSNLSCNFPYIFCIFLFYGYR
uniref:Uncharacterized protein n=1 Tax=Arundo donax TaxID=35708 RepID=A0A0A9HJD8_ARUDO